MPSSSQVPARSSRFPRREAPALLLLLALGGLLVAGSRAFRTPANLLGVGLDTSIIGVMACGEAVVLIAGGIDLSVASMLVLAAGGAALAMRAGWPIPLSLTVGLSLGAVAGGVNGWLITRLRLPPIVVTLATFGLYRAAISLLTGAREIGPLPPAFNALGLGVAPLFILAAVAGMTALTLKATRLGRGWYAVGGAEEASRVSGLPVARLKMGAYAFSGVCAAVAGFLVAASSGAMQSRAALGYELDVIAACVIGGVSIRGGQGSVAGAVAGAVLLRLMGNALLLFDIPVDWYRMVAAGVLILAAVGDRLAQREARAA